MQASLGRIIARLAEPDDQPTLDLVNLINQNIKPPTPLTEQDLYIRAMYLVSDEVNSYGGCFPADEHPRLAELLVDSPVLVGHRKDTLPIARNFHAVCQERDGHLWVKSYFYWLKASEGADTLRDNIDGGIYKECSIGFTYLLPECSICGKDIRTCSHIPMQPYSTSGGEQVCRFNYRQIERVLETSLVYRGATPDTSISKELQITKLVHDEGNIPPTITLTDPSTLPPQSLYLVTPHYEGLDCRLSFSDNRWALARLSGAPVECDLPRTLAFAAGDKTPRLARLVGYKGRERCSLAQLEKYLEGERSGVSRLMLWLIPHCEGDRLVEEDRNGHVRMIRHRFVCTDEIADACRALATKDGIDIYPVADGERVGFTYRYQPTLYADPAATFSLHPLPDSSSWLLELMVHGRSQRYLLRQFDLHRLKQGARFIADKAALHIANMVIADSGTSGAITSVRAVDEGCLIDLDGSLQTTIAVRPVKLDGRSRYLIYCPERITARKSGRVSGSTPGR